MTTTHDWQRRSRVRVRSACLAALATIALGACESSDPETQTPPPAPTPTPGLPPLAATAIPLDDGRTIGLTHWGNGNTGDGGNGQPVAGIDCVPTAPNTYHVHSHLSIFLNGEQLAIPVDVGMVELSPTTRCHYLLHTHDMSGLIHAHAGAPRSFTLGQFFAIWGQPLQRDNVAGLVGLPAVVYLTDDGTTVVEHMGSLAAIELISHREITIQVGTPITEIPRYVWTAM
jgi:hypothetical protein